MHLLIILSYKTLKLKSISNELWKGWKLAWYHHFIQIACARKLRGLRQKVDALRVQNGQSLSKYQDLIRKPICYKGISFFKTYLNSRLFLRSVGSIQSNVINFQHFLSSFALFQSFTDLFSELNDREIENHYKMNSENVETWHGIIISPTWHVQNSREGYGKKWTHFVYKQDNLF